MGYPITRKEGKESFKYMLNFTKPGEVLINRYPLNILSLLLKPLRSPSFNVV